MSYDVVLPSGVPQSESVIDRHISTPLQMLFFFLYRLLHSIEVTYLKLCNYQHNRDPDKFCHFPHTLQIPSCCLFIVNPSLHPQDRSSANLLELICFDCFFFLLISFMQQLSIESTMCWALLEVLGMIW